MHSEDGESHEGLLREKTDSWDDSAVRQQSTQTRAGFIPWILSIFFFCTTITFAWQSRTSPTSQICNNRTGNSSGTYETGFSTDFVSDHPPISLKLIPTTFTNSLHFNSTSQELYNAPLFPNETIYIGPQSPAIDAAWHDLLHDQYVAISASEAEQFPPTHRQRIAYAGQDNFYFELSVFHYLHCLNEIRIALERSYAPEPPTQRAGDIFAGRAHIDHCIDQLRQAVQCQADLTPVPMLPVEGGPGNLVIGNGEAHICRDFDAVRGWVRERNGDGGVGRALGD